MIEFFTDPILRAPMWGCLLMCIASSLMGVTIFLRKRSLVSEALSHATYPGACLAVALFSLFFPRYEEWLFLAILGGALASSWLGLKMIEKLERIRVRSDAALCFVLALFFGVGLVIASFLQDQFPVGYKQVQLLLFGQAATMNDLHIWIYGGLALTVALLLFLLFHPLQATLFDRDFALSSGLKVALLERILFWLLLLSLIVGIRSVGVVLMSAMVIAPAVAARQFSDRLKTVFFLASLFGAISGVVGNALSVKGHLPTGPLIVLVATTLALLSLLLAPNRGLLFRWARILSFRLRCIEENGLKALWKRGKWTKKGTFLSAFVLWKLQREGWVDSEKKLTPDGQQRAGSIVRLHRLWELYLTQGMGLSAEKVHHSAEEMEHILPPDMERRLTSFLQNPKTDPHHQPIPEKEE